MYTNLTVNIVFAVALLVGASTLVAQDAVPAQSQQQVEQIVRQYILDHPEVVLESIKSFQQREQAKQRERAKGSIITREADLLRDASSPFTGKSDADISVVEFFDYHCGYCKKVHPTVMKLLADNPRVRVVFKEFPILGAESMIAAKAGLAAQRQGAYLQFHQELMTTTQPFTLENIERIALKLGLNAARLKTDMESPEILAALTHNQELGSALGVNATPSFVIDSELVSGAVDAAGFQALIDRAIAGINDKAASNSKADGNQKPPSDPKDSQLAPSKRAGA